jgi:hypothetical protein
MPEIDRAKRILEGPRGTKDNCTAAAEADINSLSFLEKLDGHTIIQDVVMSELLGRPKARRRKRGHY